MRWVNAVVLALFGLLSALALARDALGSLRRGHYVEAAADGILAVMVATILWLMAVALVEGPR